MATMVLDPRWTVFPSPGNPGGMWGIDTKRKTLSDQTVTNWVRNVTANTYSEDIAISSGFRRINGSLIWSTSISERVRTTVTKTIVTGGNPLLGAPDDPLRVYPPGFTSNLTNPQKTVTVATNIAYPDQGKLFASFAVSFGYPLVSQVNGSTARITKLYFDGILVYDSAALNTNLPGLKFKLYNGSEDQVADPTIEKYLGIGNVPAYRGQMYVVFTDVEVTQFGTRIPTVSAMIADASTGSNQQRNFSGTHNNQQYNYAVDWSRNRVYTIDTASKTIGVWDTMIGRLLRVLSVPEMHTTNALEANAEIIEWLNLLAVHTGTFSNRVHLLVDASTGAVIANFADYGSVPQSADIACAHYIVANDTVRTFYAFADFDGDIYKYELVKINDIVTPSAPVIIGSTGHIDSYCRGPSSSSNALIYIGRENGRIEVLNAVTGGLSLIKQRVGIKPSFMIYDFNDHSLVILWGDGVSEKLDADDYSAKWTNTWTTIVTRTNSPNGQFGKSIIDFGQLAVLPTISGLNAEFRVIDLLTGDQTLVPNSTLNASYDFVYDGRSHSILSIGASRPYRLYIDRAEGEGTQNLSSILYWLSRYAGMEHSEIYVDPRITDVVNGFLLASEADYWGVVSNIADVFGIDIGESPDGVAFTKTADSTSFVSVVTVPQDDLAPLDAEAIPKNNNDPFTNARLIGTRGAASSQIGRVAVHHIDPSFDYSINMQEARRSAGLVVGEVYNGRVDYHLPLIMSATLAMTKATEKLYSLKESRIGTEFRLGPKYYDLEPSDVITIQEGSYDYTVKLLTVTYNTDWTLSCQAEAYRVADNDSTRPGGEGTPADQEIPGPSFSQLIWLDMPLLNPEDDTGGTNLLQYYALTSDFAVGWRGGYLLRSDDDFQQDVETVADTTFELPIGYANGVLAAAANVFQYDETNTLSITLQSGTTEGLESVTDDEWLAGATLAAVGNVGRWEIIAWRDITVVDEQTFTISRLLRGLRGSHVFHNTHQAGDYFIPLAFRTTSLLFDPAELNIPHDYKAVGYYLDPEAVATKALAATGSAEKPFAPINHVLTRAVDNSLNLSWDRQSRTSLGLQSNGAYAVPLGEETEEYAVDILAGPGGAVVRTVAGLAAPSMTYSEADQITDGFVPPLDKLTVKVYQISALVGRGFTYERTVNV